MSVKIDAEKLLGFRLEGKGAGGLKMGGKGGGAVGGKVTGPMSIKMGTKDGVKPPAG
ncbi:MAG: hypothetical protein JXQ91_19770 [Vannielia sp.]|uniref:hypothetical protein n=1 Tax=Vannielia sp. TaxID=2813045 RepID=UPI003B8B8738